MLLLPAYQSLLPTQLCTTNRVFFLLNYSVICMYCYWTQQGTAKDYLSLLGFRVKYLKDKPVNDIKGDMFLKLNIAERDRLITMTISDHFHGLTLRSSYIEEAKQLYYRVSGLSKSLWLLAIYILCRCGFRRKKQIHNDPDKYENINNLAWNSIIP